MPDIHDILAGLSPHDALQILAGHEAGHAIVGDAFRLGCRTIWVDMNSREGQACLAYNGHNLTGAAVAIAGYAAEQILAGNASPSMWTKEERGSSGDWGAFTCGVVSRAVKSCPGRRGESKYTACFNAFELDALDAAVSILTAEITLLHKVQSIIVGMKADANNVRELMGRELCEALDPLPVQHAPL